MTGFACPVEPGQGGSVSGMPSLLWSLSLFQKQSKVLKLHGKLSLSGKEITATKCSMELKSSLAHFTAKHVTNEASHLAFLEVLLERDGLVAFDCIHPIQPVLQKLQQQPSGHTVL